MFPSTFLALLLLFLGADALMGQPVNDIRLSPDDRPATVARHHQSLSSASLGDQTMVAWGKTELDSLQQEHGVLMLGHLDGREWTAPPVVLAKYDPGEWIAVHLVAIDSLFLLLWESGEEESPLYARAYHRDGTPATDSLEIGKEGVTGIRALHDMPGIAVVRRTQEPTVSLEYREGKLIVRELNPLIQPGLSFRVDRDTALWAIADGELLYYSSIYEEEPEWRMAVPKADSQAAHNHAFIATVSDSGFALVLFSTFFSEGYSKYGSNDSARAQVQVHHFDREGRSYRVDTLWDWTSVFGNVVTGFGSMIGHQGAWTGSYCDGSQIIYLQLEAQYMRASSPLGLPTTIRRGIEVSADGEISDMDKESYPALPTFCTPSGKKYSTHYQTRDGILQVRVWLPEGSFFIPADSEQPTVARTEPRLVVSNRDLHIVWKDPYTSDRLRKVEAFNQQGTRVVDLHPGINIPDLPKNHGCYSVSDKSHEITAPGSLINNTQIWRVCYVVDGGNSQQLVGSFYPGVRILVVNSGRYRSLLDTVCPPPPWGGSTTETGFSTTGMEPDDETLLVLGEEYRTSSQGRRHHWVEGIMSTAGDFLWRSTDRTISPGYALPIGDRRWVAFNGDTLRLMDTSSLQTKIVLPSLAGRGTARFQSLPGPWIARTFETVGQGERSLVIQLAELELGFVTERRLTLPEGGTTLPYIVTHPGDGSRFVIWGGTEGVYATRYTPNLDGVLMPPTRISETTGVATRPSATFVDDTLTVVWEDHRHGTPAIYGLQWGVEPVEGMSGVEEQESVPEDLDISWRGRM